MYRTKIVIAFLCFIGTTFSFLFAIALGGHPAPPELAYPVPMAQFGLVLLAILLLTGGLTIYPFEGPSFAEREKAEK